MDLTEINCLTDGLLVKLRDSTSSAEVRDLAFRLDGFYRGAQIKALLPEVTAKAWCGFRWKWGQGREQHYEICTLAAGHDGTHHLNETTGINKRKSADCICSWATRQAMPESNTVPGSHHDEGCPLFSGAHVEPTKPVADRLHEAVSRWRSHADSFEAVALENSEEAGLITAFRSCARELEAMLMEGGI